jgi:lysine-specific demethylase 3
LFLLFVPQVDKWKVSYKDTIKCSHRIAHYLLPWLKDFHNEQMKEKYVEAAIKGNCWHVEMPPFEFPA